VGLDVAEPPLVAAAVTAVVCAPLVSLKREERRLLACLCALACETAPRRRSGTALFATARLFVLCLTVSAVSRLVVAALVAALW
jgi:hypothetical protein